MSPEPATEPTDLDLDRLTESATDSAPRPAKKAAAKKAPAAKKAAAPKKPPRLGGTGGAGRPSRAATVGKLTETVRQLAGGLIVAGESAGRPAWAYDGKVIAHRADDIGRELYDLASRSEPVAKALESLYGVGRQFDGLATILGTAVPILVAHGRLPASAMGAPGVGGAALVEAIGAPPAPAPPAPAPPASSTRTPPEPTRPWAGRRRRPPAPEPEDQAEPEVPAAPPGLFTLPDL